MVERLGFIPALLLIPTRWRLRRDRDGRWLRSAEARVDGEIGNVAINDGMSAVHLRADVARAGQHVRDGLTSGLMHRSNCVSIR